MKVRSRRAADNSDAQGRPDSCAVELAAIACARGTNSSEGRCSKQGCTSRRSSGSWPSSSTSVKLVRLMSSAVSVLSFVRAATSAMRDLRKPSRRSPAEHNYQMCALKMPAVACRTQAAMHPELAGAGQKQLGLGCLELMKTARQRADASAGQLWPCKMQTDCPIR